MKLKYLSGVAVTVLMMVCLVSSGATDVRLFPFSKDVGLPESAAKNVAVFHLDEEIFASTEDGYTNFRLFDGNENEKPFLVRAAKATRTETVEGGVDVETVGFQKLPDNRVEMIYSKKDKDSGKLPVAVVFVTTLKNYEKQVTVWGSNDRSSWEPLAENQPIFDYSRFIDVRNCRVAIKAGKYVYYKILVSNITENQQSPLVNIARETRSGLLASEVENSSFRREDFRMDRIDFIERRESIVRSKSLVRTYPVKNLSVTNDVKAKVTIVTFDTGRAPVTALKIVNGSSNFSRALRVECSVKKAEGGDGWRHVAASSISRIDAGGFKQESIKIDLGGVIRSKTLRVVIDNRDSPPLDVSGVEAEGEIHESVFFPEKAKSFCVMYGAEGLNAPVYDIADVLARVTGADGDVCSVGLQKNNPKYIAAARRPIEGRKLLVVAVLLMIAGLVWIISRAVKNVDSSQVQ